MRLYVIAVLLLALSACNNYSRLLKGTDYDRKFDAAVKYYEKKDYQKALPLLEDLLNYYKGTQQAEKVYYYYAYCNFGIGDFVFAGYHFKNFCETYPQSPLREECFYMFALCDYKESLPYYLDQSKTYSAMQNLQLFINLYPGSKLVPECNVLIDQLRGKLHEKAYKSAKLFYQIEDYKSAVMAFRSAIKRYPDIPYKEEMEYLIIRSGYLYAKNSIESKQQERYEDVLEDYQNFVLDYPTSQYSREASNIYKDALSALDHIKNARHKAVKDNSTAVK